MGHKAKPIKPFLRQNKKGVFQYATEGRAEQSNVSRTYKPCLTPGSRCCPARGQQQAPNLGVLSNLHWKASLFDYVTGPALNWIRHLKLDSVNIHTPPSPPQLLNMHVNHLPGSVLAFFKLYCRKKYQFWNVKLVRSVWTRAVFGSACIWDAESFPARVGAGVSCWGRVGKGVTGAAGEHTEHFQWDTHPVQFWTVLLQPVSNTSPYIVMLLFLKFWCIQRLDNSAGIRRVLVAESNISENLGLVAIWGVGTKSFSAAAVRLNNNSSLGYQLMWGPREKTAFRISVTDIGNTLEQNLPRPQQNFQSLLDFFQHKAVVCVGCSLVSFK